MKKKGLWRTLLLYVVTGYCLLYALPTVVPSVPQWYLKIFPKTLGFGLDLQGGLELRYAVDYRAAIENNILKVRDGIETRLVEAMAGAEKKDADKLSKEELKAYASRFSIEKTNFNALKITFKNKADAEHLTSDLLQTLDSQLALGGSGIEKHIELPPRAVLKIRREVVDQTIDIIRKRVSAFGLIDPDVRKAGEAEIDVQLPGLRKDRMDFVRERIGQTAQLTFRMVDTASSFLADKAAALAEFKAKNPERAPTLELVGTRYLKAANKSELVSFTKTLDVPDTHIFAYEYIEDRDPKTRAVRDKYWRTWMLFRRVNVSGDRVTRSFVAYDQKGAPYVSIEFDRRGADEFEETTEKHVNDVMAIVLDDEVSSAPTIEEPIRGGRARITMGKGRPPREVLPNAQALVTVLTHGAYKAPVHLVHDFEVGPTLGKDTVRAGIMAMAVGTATVVIFMLLYYRLAGIVANIALLLNLLYITAILIAFNTKLTLPGMAGIVLTVGMAVDANVLINERIREELRAGRSLRAAIQTGYGRAFWAVFDANVTTALAAVILLSYTGGTLHNFAVTLLIGIVSSMFTAVYVTRKIYDWAIDRGRLTELKF